MRIALIQQHATREKRVNVERGLDALRRAVDDGAQCACFTELGFEWFHPQQPAPLNVAALAAPVPGPTTEASCRVARERSLVVLLNLYERDGENLYDCSPVMFSSPVRNRRRPYATTWASWAIM